jgi:SAM-dependent methyltransferase
MRSSEIFLRLLRAFRRARAARRRLAPTDGPPDPNDYHTTLANEAATYLDIRGKRVLVVGCNTGGDCRQMLRLGAATVDGIDVIEETGAGFVHPKVRYHRMPAEQMTFPDDSFDFVYCVATMEHVHEIEASFREMARVLAPGGYVYSVAAPLWNSIQGSHKSDLFPDFPWIHLRRTRDEIVAYAHSRGIEAPGGIESHVDYMLDDRWFNKAPGRRYIAAGASLSNTMKLVRNDVWLTPEASLAPDVLAELEPQGYSSHELRALTHTLVARKRSGRPSRSR